jgi:hypothetical protein
MILKDFIIDSLTNGNLVKVLPTNVNYSGYLPIGTDINLIKSVYRYVGPATKIEFDSLVELSDRFVLVDSFGYVTATLPDIDSLFFI